MHQVGMQDHDKLSQIVFLKESFRELDSTQFSWHSFSGSFERF